jgi:hypothetical protein
MRWGDLCCGGDDGDDDDDDDGAGWAWEVDVH